MLVCDLRIYPAGMAMPKTLHKTSGTGSAYLVAVGDGGGDRQSGQTNLNFYAETLTSCCMAFVFAWLSLDPRFQPKQRASAVCIFVGTASKASASPCGTVTGCKTPFLQRPTKGPVS